MSFPIWKVGFGLVFAWLMTSGAIAVAQGPSDHTITFWVVEALREDPRVKFSDIHVESRNGVVTLTGSVVSLAESNFARLVALKIQGVRGVVNQLEVQPSNRSDADIAKDVRRRILQSSSVKARDLTVKVGNGVVGLAGIVGSLSQRHETTLLAGEVRGVREIQNDIKVDNATRRADAEISKDIEAAMRRDVYLNTLPIKITVNEGTVVLTGTVGNAYQKERATQEARRIANVRAIDNRLQVEWWRERGVRGEMPRPSDDQLQESVYAELDQDERINAGDITVTAEGGHVTLRGSVGTYYERQLAEQDALSVAGALWVSTLLGVRDHWRDDREVASDATFGLQSDSLLRSQRIDVRVSDGVITLSGTVNTANEKVHAAELAGRVRGVRSVNNKIEVRWGPKFQDAALAARVKTRIQANWETRWVASKISVKVTSGKVTLTGEVNTWAEWREAGRIAYLTDGVWSVDNQLSIAKVSYRWSDWHSGRPPVYYDAYPEYRLYFFERRF